MDIENNKCLLAYAKMIKSRYENGELLTYLLPRIDHFITYCYGEFRGFIAHDYFRGKRITWDCDGENYYKIVIEDSELNLDSFEILNDIDPSDISFFEIEGWPAMEYESDYNVMNYILTFLIEFHSYVTSKFKKDEKIFNLIYFAMDYLKMFKIPTDNEFLTKTSQTFTTEKITITITYYPHENLEFSSYGLDFSIPIKKP